MYLIITGIVINLVKYIFPALKILSKPGNVPAMINCAHGKDRTGVVSALIQGLLGKSDDEIADDYAQSEVSRIQYGY